MSHKRYEFELDSLKETEQVAQKILEICKKSKIYAIYGDLGAGKTTLVKFFCKFLGSTDEVTSPTYALVNEYRYHDGEIFHFDFYRLKNPQEALDIGCEDYFDSGSYCFVEWPELVESFLPEDQNVIRISSNSENKRTLELLAYI